MKAAILSLFTSLISITCTAPGASYSGGDGSESNPYRIAVVNDLLTLRNSWGDYDAYFILVDDIDLSGYTFDKALIAPDVDIYEDFHQGAAFAGSFDGNGYAISNLSIYSGNAEIGYVGLFGFAAEEARIHNLTVRSVNISSLHTSYSSCGCLVGLNAGVIDNCAVQNCSVASPGSLRSTGAVVGINDTSGVISNCVAQCTIDTEYGSTLGGFVGNNLGEIVSCTANVFLDVREGLNAGGFVGTNYGTIRLCAAGGSLSLPCTTGAGGFAGLNGSSRGTIDGCTSSCQIGGAPMVADTGGFAGKNTNVITHCTSTGNVTVDGTGSQATGGFCGRNSGSVTYCKSSGNTRGYAGAGGFIGNNTGTIRSCAASGSIDAMLERASGFADFNSGTISDSYVCGNCLWVGAGLVSYDQFGTIENCYVSGSGYNFGGLVNSVRGTTIRNCVWQAGSSTPFDSIDETEPYVAENLFGLNQTAMQQISTYLAIGWDFTCENANGTEDIWQMCQDGVDYPRLRWELNDDCPGCGIITVSLDGSADYTTIQAAIDAAADGVEIVVADGVYTGDGNRDIDFKGKAITLRSAGGPDNCVIDCEGVAGHRGFYLPDGQGCAAAISGFTIRGGLIEAYESRGGGIYCQGYSLLIENCVITGNVVRSRFHEFIGGEGGGLYCASSNVALDSCIISGNSAYGITSWVWGTAASGGGVYCGESSALDMVNCTMRDNTARGGDGEFDGSNFCGEGGDAFGGGLCFSSDSTGTLSRSIVSGNVARGGDGSWGDGGGPVGECSARGGVGHGGGVYGNAGVSLRSCVLMGNSTPYWSEGKGGGAFACGEITNCTIISNTARTAGGGVFGGNAVKSSIVCANSAPTGPNVSGTSAVTYSNIGGGYTGEGNIDADPGFVDTYHISAGSPCINGGDPDFVFGDDEKDIDGQPRIMQGRVDMGADEVKSELTALDAWPVTLHFEGSSIEEIDAQEIRIQNAGTGLMIWQAIEDCPWLTLSPAAGDSSGEADVVAVTVDVSALAPGTYTCEITVDAGAAIRSPASIAVQLICRPVDAVWSVPQDYATIQQAVDLARDGDTVLVAAGTYTGQGNTDIDFKGKAITVRSANGPAGCVIDCQNFAGRRGFYLHSGEASHSVIKGFTVTRGHANGHPARGGAILCEGAAPTIEDCILIANKAQPPHDSSHYHGSPAYGGALYCSGNGMLTVRGCQIIDNAASGALAYHYDPGAGMYTIGEGGDAFGGGLYIGPGIQIVMEECQVRSNRAIGADGDGGMPAEFAVFVNEAGGGEGGGLYAADGSSAQIRDSVFADNMASGGAPGMAEGGNWATGGVFAGGGLRVAAANMSNCTVTANVGSAGDEPAQACAGAGIYHAQGDLSLVNCLLAANEITSMSWSSGVALESRGNVSLRNCTITHSPTPPLFPPDDPPSAVWVYGAGTISNCIMWSNEGNDIGGYHISKAVTHSCTEQVVAGDGNIHVDPLFVTGPNGDYYLSQVLAGQAVDSPCVDGGSGLATDLGLGTTRTDGVADDAVVDMGYHYPAALNVADLNEDGIVDIKDWGWFAAAWLGRVDGRIPKGSVTVDGYASEWGTPEWIMLDKVYYGEPSDVDDARMAMRWDSVTNRIYAVVQVHDNTPWLTEAYTRWDASDRIEIYCQGKAVGGTGWNTYYDTAQQYMVGADDAGGAWANWGLGGTIGEDAAFEYAARVSGDMAIYEIGVKVFDSYGGLSGGETAVTALQAGSVVGFDLTVDTRWAANGFGMLSANEMHGKSIDAGRFARWLLVDTAGPCQPQAEDLDGNCLINFADVAIFVENWLGM